jgi:hypothetical protein
MYREHAEHLSLFRALVTAAPTARG